MNGRMPRRRRSRRTPPAAVIPSAPAFRAAATAYAANCALGAAVWFRLVDTSRFRWVHHALYVVTVVATIGAATSAAWGAPRNATREAVGALAPAAVPLAVIPYAGTRGRRHPLVALAAAPFYLAALARITRPDPTR